MSHNTNLQFVFQALFIRQKDAPSVRSGCDVSGVGKGYGVPHLTIGASSEFMVSGLALPKKCTPMAVACRPRAAPCARS